MSHPMAGDGSLGARVRAAICCPGGCARAKERGGDPHLIALPCHAPSYATEAHVVLETILASLSESGYVIVPRSSVAAALERKDAPI